MKRCMHSSPQISYRRCLITAVFLILLLFLLVVIPASADTNMGGTINTDTTWTVSASPYIVTANITVKGTDGTDGITKLTFQPGVALKFNQYRSPDIGVATGDGGAL